LTDLSQFLARYGLPAAALSFAAGIAYGRYGPVPPGPLAWILALLVVALILLNFARSWRHVTEPASVTLLFLLAGAILIGNPSTPEHTTTLTPLLDTGNNVILSGRLATAPSYNGVRGKMLFQADRHWQPDGTISPITEQIILAMPFAVPDHFEPGNRLLVRATLSRPQPPGTPGSFDYRQYLADRNIHITGYLRSPACLAALHLSSSTESWLTTLHYWPQRVRQKVNRFIAAAPLPPEAIGLYQALVTGELELIPDETLAAFRTSGAFHLLSISGTHLALLGLLCGLTFNFLLRRSRYLLLNFSVTKITAALTILVLLLYSLLAGMNPPVVRSLIMAVCLIGAMLINRPHSLPNSLGLAMLVSLIWNPADLFYASFQLSYAAVIGIVTLHIAMGSRFKTGDKNPADRLYRWLLASLAVSLAALLATAPLTQYHFRQVAMISPLSTLLLAPLLCFWALPLGLAASLLSAWFPTAATSLLELGSLGLTGSVWLNTHLAGLPINTWQPPIMPLAAIPFYYLGLVSLLLSRNSLPARTISAAALAVTMILMISPTIAPANSGETRVTFLDVGQGSATLLELPGGRNILVDGGSSGGEGYDVGAQVIAPFLHHQGIRSLEAMVITHDHGDHHNGLATIIKEFPPATVWTNANAKRSPELAEVLTQAVRCGATIKVPVPDENILATPDNLLTCLSRHHQQGYADLPENQRSLVLRLNSRGRIFLLPGDIMAADGQNLQEEGESLRCDVLLAPHHGSDNSASLLLGETGRPNLLIVSAGGYEGGKFPGKKVREWCGQNGVNIHRTGTDGAITFTVGPAGLSWRRLSAKSGAPNTTEAE
jgi:competence protein ComEC